MILDKVISFFIRYKLKIIFNVLCSKAYMYQSYYIIWIGNKIIVGTYIHKVWGKKVHLNKYRLAYDNKIVIVSSKLDEK